MNFQNFYQSAPALSFEVFPPKSQTGITALFQALEELARFRPAFISVTYGAMGSTRDLTRDLALKIKSELRLTTAFHFTCVGSDHQKIRGYVEGLKKHGIDLVVALRGDPPPGENFVALADGFQHANELVTFLKELGGFSIAVAGYPEGHMEAPDLATDLKNLKKKVDAGADIVITQLFFDNQYYFDFVARCRDIGIRIPIIPGIMPILSIKQIEKIAGMCGAKIPPDLKQRLLACGENDKATVAIGIEHATLQCAELLKQGAPGLHFYILNKAHSAQAILGNLQKLNLMR